ncbi:MAG: IS110 family transposase [Chryseobacterium sp.]|nr:MAG: IS110 family transposase [Chryseobacterium sp.]
MGETIVKQVAGIDVAQDELVVSLGDLKQDLSTRVLAFKVFKNNAEGFLQLTEWVNKLTDQHLGVHYVMEATGVYHQAFAYFLSDQHCKVSVIVPNKISNYMRTLDIKTVTDKTSSEAIMMFGLQRSLKNWQPPGPIYKRLCQLIRERDQVVNMRTMAKNHLHAEKAEAQPHKDSLKRISQQIAFFDKQVIQIVDSINQLINENAELKRRIRQICTIPGVGLLTAATVLAETNGFDLITSKKQLVSYAGLDVREKQSGTSVRGKARISKKGNRHLRKCLYMPSLTAIRHNERLKAIYARLISRHGVKMKAGVAVQRKLLEMIYTLYKKDENYDPMYMSKKLESSKTAP